MRNKVFYHRCGWSALLPATSRIHPCPSCRTGSRVKTIRLGMQVTTPAGVGVVQEFASFIIAPETMPRVKVNESWFKWSDVNV
jgi:hypothetical protein